MNNIRKAASEDFRDADHRRNSFADFLFEFRETMGRLQGDLELRGLTKAGTRQNSITMHSFASLLIKAKFVVLRFRKHPPRSFAELLSCKRFC